MFCMIEQRSFCCQKLFFTRGNAVSITTSNGFQAQIQAFYTVC